MIMKSLLSVIRQCQDHHIQGDLHTNVQSTMMIIINKSLGERIVMIMFLVLCPRGMVVTMIMKRIVMIMFLVLCPRGMVVTMIMKYLQSIKIRGHIGVTHILQNCNVHKKRTPLVKNQEVLDNQSTPSQKGDTEVTPVTAQNLQIGSFQVQQSTKLPMTEPAVLYHQSTKAVNLLHTEGVTLVITQDPQNCLHDSNIRIQKLYHQSII